MPDKPDKLIKIVSLKSVVIKKKFVLYFPNLERVLNPFKVYITTLFTARNCFTYNRAAISLNTNF